MNKTLAFAAVAGMAASACAAPMLTEWGEKVTSDNCWRGYPRPQMVRPNWTSLNGEWSYAVTSVTNTPGRPEKWDGRILVPFPLESTLSGVGRVLRPDEFLWYTRKIVCDPKPGERILLHFGAVDFRAMVFIGHDEVTDVPDQGNSEIVEIFNQPDDLPVCSDTRAGGMALVGEAFYVCYGKKWREVTAIVDAFKPTIVTGELQSEDQSVKISGKTYKALFTTLANYQDVSPYPADYIAAGGSLGDTVHAVTDARGIVYAIYS